MNLSPLRNLATKNETLVAAVIVAFCISGNLVRSAVPVGHDINRPNAGLCCYWHSGGCRNDGVDFRWNRCEFYSHSGICDVFDNGVHLGSDA